MGVGLGFGTVALTGRLLFLWLKIDIIIRFC